MTRRERQAKPFAAQSIGNPLAAKAFLGQENMYIVQRFPFFTFCAMKFDQRVQTYRDARLVAMGNTVTFFKLQMKHLPVILLLLPCFLFQ